MSDLKNKAEELKKTAEDTVKKAEEKVEELAEDVMEKVSGAGDPFQDIPRVPLNTIDDDLRNNA